MTPKILSSCHPVGQPDSMTRSYLVTLCSALPRARVRDAAVPPEHGRMDSARHVIGRHVIQGNVFDL
jgi:hypothetical protein